MRARSITQSREETSGLRSSSPKYSCYLTVVRSSRLLRRRIYKQIIPQRHKLRPQDLKLRLLQRPRLQRHRLPQMLRKNLTQMPRYKLPQRFRFSAFAIQAASV